MIRWLIDRAVLFFGLVLAGRKVKSEKLRTDDKVCVNLGCGLAVAPGWINVDASLNALFAGSPKWALNLLHRLSGANRYYSREEYCRLLRQPRFVFHDLARSLPFRDSSVDFFYSSHFFEHLFKRDAARLMNDAYRALTDGGIIRIAVPDLTYAIALYSEGDKLKMLDDYFFVEDKSSYLARHKYMYDFELLSRALREAGFRNVRRCEFSEGKVPDLTKLDNRPGETLFVEATK